MVGRAQSPEEGKEASGAGGVAVVVVVVGAMQVRLFDQAHLELQGGHECDEAGDGNQVADHEHQPEGCDAHGGGRSGCGRGGTRRW